MIGKTIRKHINRARHAGIGSEKNPLKLVPENCNREALQRSINSKSVDNFNGSIFDITKLPNSFESPDEVFKQNVNCNVNLSAKEKLVATFLLNFLLCEHDESEIFTTNGKLFKHHSSLKTDIFATSDVKQERLVGHYGDDSFHLVIGHQRRRNWQYLDLECPDLVSTLRNNNIKISPSRLAPILRKLHEYSYITITDVHIYNTYAVSHLISDEERTNIRARIRHIRLCRSMMNKDLSKYWKRYS